MGISIDCYRAAIGLFNSRIIRYHLLHVSFTLINLAVVSVLMLAFYTQVICLSFDIQINPGPVSSPNLSLAHVNIRSLLTRDKIDQISAFLEVYKFDIFALSETWLNSNESDKIRINGYHLPLTRNRLQGRGGGVALYLANYLAFNRRLDLENPVLELLWSEVILSNSKILIGVCYRPPSNLMSDMDNFLSLFQESIDQINRLSYTMVIIVGDFNAHFCSDDQTSTTAGSIFARFLRGNNLFQLINEPTRITASSQTILDLVITDSPGYCISHYTLSPPANCDHNVVVATFNLSIPRPKAYKRYIWNFKSVDVNSLNHSLSTFNWENLFDSFVDIDTLYDTWFSTFTLIVKKFISLREVTIRPRDKPWMTGKIRRSIRKRDRLLRKFRSTNSLADWNKYKKQRNLTVSIIRKEKVLYFAKVNSMLCDPKLNAKKWWGVVKSLYGVKACSQIPPLKEGDIFISDSLQKAELFNNYFVAQSTLGSHNSTPYIPGRFSGQSLTHVSANPIEVLNLLKGVDSTKACGHDGIGNRIINLCSYGIYSSFTKLINISFSLGQFPSQWKLANVIPVFKKDERYLKTNFRPVSLLPSLSKIGEKIVFIRLYNYLQDIGFLYPFQSGFRPGHSTVLQLTYIIHRIYHCLEEGKEVRAVFLDISKAFDRVWHDGLLTKLKYLGIEDPLFSWLRSYLFGRHQRVVLEGTYSEWKSTTAGVPQGSVLGPLLFLVYINDIVDNIHSQVFLYADDSMLLDIIDSPNETAEKLNSDLSAVANWAKKWNVIMNASKTRSMIFSVKKIKPCHPPLLLNNEIIPDVTSHCHLGINLSTDLSWHNHINIIHEKASKRLNMLKGLKFLLKRSTLNIMYLTLVRPLVEYADFVWDGCTNECSDTLEKMQLEAARLVTGAIKGTNRQLLLAELSWDTLKTRRHIHKISGFYKITKNLVPNYLSTLLPPPVSQRTNYLLRNRENVSTMRCSTSRFQYSFFPSAIIAWNLLPIDIRNSFSFNNFKSKVYRLLSAGKRSKLFEVGHRYASVLHTRLRLKNSTLNFDLFLHNCIPSPACVCGYYRETSKHYLLHCPRFNVHRARLLTLAAECLHHHWTIANDFEKLELLLYGCNEVDFNSNRTLFLAVQNFIINSNRFAIS